MAGDKLKGKKLVVSLTTGTPAEMYSKEGAAGHEIDEYLLPVVSTCALCGMEYAGRVYTPGMSPMRHARMRRRLPI